MNTGFPPPYQNSVVSGYLRTEQPVGGVQQDNTGSVLKPVEEVKATAPSQNTVANQASTRTNSGEQGNANQAQAQATSPRQDRLEARQQLLEQQQIQQLSARDREVRNHERAHAAVGGQYAGAPRYQYERGPDGVNYAIAGEVSINASAVNGNPQATLDKAQVIRRAALAPADPSPQDRRVAAQATQMEVQARAELVALQRQERLAAAEAAEGEREVENEAVPNTEEARALTPEPEEKEPFFDLSEQQNALNRLSVDLSRRIIGSDIEAQAPRPGQIVSRFA